MRQCVLVLNLNQNHNAAITLSLSLSLIIWTLLQWFWPAACLPCLPSKIKDSLSSLTFCFPRPSKTLSPSICQMHRPTIHSTSLGWFRNALCWLNNLFNVLLHWAGSFALIPPWSRNHRIFMEQLQLPALWHCSWNHLLGLRREQARKFWGIVTRQRLSDHIGRIIRHVCFTPPLPWWCTEDRPRICFQRWSPLVMVSLQLCQDVFAAVFR